MPLPHLPPSQASAPKLGVTGPLPRVLSCTEVSGCPSHPVPDPWEPGPALPPLSRGLLSWAGRAELGHPTHPLLTGGDADAIVGAPRASGRVGAASKALALVTVQALGCGDGRVSRGRRVRWTGARIERDTGVGNAGLTTPSLPTQDPALILRTLGSHPGGRSPLRPSR